jgi:uncharacterized protein YndB with AHSA1/START domain
MGVHEYSVWIKAAPDDVWRVYTDPARIPDWQTGSPVITDVQGRQAEQRSTYVSRRGPGAARTTVVEAARPHKLVTSTEAYFGLRLDVISLLDREADGTRLHLRAETHWPRGRGLIGRLVEVAILRRREAERSSPTSRPSSSASPSRRISHCGRLHAFGGEHAGGEQTAVVDTRLPEGTRSTGGDG